MLLISSSGHSSWHFCMIPSKRTNPAVLNYPILTVAPLNPSLMLTATAVSMQRLRAKESLGQEVSYCQQSEHLSLEESIFISLCK